MNDNASTRGAGSHLSNLDRSQLSVSGQAGSVAKNNTPVLGFSPGLIDSTQDVDGQCFAVERRTTEFIIAKH